MIQLNDVVVRYEGASRNALDGVSLSVASGETVALVGPSGSGKTTLLRTINGLVPIISGNIIVDGVDVQNTRGRALRALRARIAMIAQQHDLVERLSVYQNVMAGALGRWSSLHALRFLALPLASELEEATAALARVGIAAKLKSRTSDLSGGERQRVAIARALVQHPDILLADEPVASLDEELATQIVELMCALAKETGVTLVCSLHQQDLAERYFDRVIHAGTWTSRPTILQH